MLITKNLEALFAKAGRAEARRREADARRQAEDRRKEQRQARRRRKAKVMEPGAAARIWSWLAGPDADEIRAQLARAGLAEVRLLGWTTLDGRALRVSTYGAWSVWLRAKPAALRIHRVALPPGGRSRVIENRRALLAEAPTEIILALDQAIATRLYVRNVHASLRERLAPRPR
ncbi:MAG TPA: hypothetical protein VGY54_11355 [Polyangiaceae bacterium]|nr:hypothetical protein [Polyangiaceae bacterium]